MSAAKTVARGVVILGALASPLRADSISSGGGSWVYFFGSSGGSAFRSSSTGFFSARSSTTVPVLKPIVAPTPPPPPAPVPAPAPAPAPAAAPAPAPAPAAVVTEARPAVSAPATVTNFAQTTWNGSTADAFLNFGNASYAEASSLTVGNPQPWYTSPSVTKFFNGAAPDAQQQADFTSKVLQTVQNTFALSNLYPKLTLDPNASAYHSMSIVSGASYGPNPNAIGITDVGHSGFGFIDKLSYAQTLDQLATAVGKNVSHELMHAFGVGSHPDSTGAYVDAGTASWDLLTNPNSTFSPSAVQAINDTHFAPYFGDPAASGQTIDGSQEILAAPVPEPMTVLIWAAGIGGVVLVRQRRPARRPA